MTVDLQPQLGTGRECPEPGGGQGHPAVFLWSPQPWVIAQLPLGSAQHVVSAFCLETCLTVLGPVNPEMSGGEAGG